MLPGCGTPTAETAGTEVAFRPAAVKPVQTPIIEPPIERATELGSSQFVKDDDLVIGVALNGDYRAYPLNQLTGPKQEVINDYLGDQPILVTW